MMYQSFFSPNKSVLSNKFDRMTTKSPDTLEN